MDGKRGHRRRDHWSMDDQPKQVVWPKYPRSTAGDQLKVDADATGGSLAQARDEPFGGRRGNPEGVAV
jgi:hypothetical protein